MTTRSGNCERSTVSRLGLAATLPSCGDDNPVRPRIRLLEVCWRVLRPFVPAYCEPDTSAAGDLMEGHLDRSLSEQSAQVSYPYRSPRRAQKIHSLPTTSRLRAVSPPHRCSAAQLLKPLPAIRRAAGQTRRTKRLRVGFSTIGQKIAPSWHLARNVK